MTDFRADLHCHSTCSDGSKSPTDLVTLAANIGLMGLSITDHDSIAAYAEAVPVAEALGIRLVSGVEFSTEFRGESIHLLAYAFPLHSEQILRLCARHHQRRQERCRRMMDSLAQRGVDVSDDEQLQTALERAPSVGRPHIAAALIRRGVVRSTDAAFKQYLGQGCPCYVSVTPISTEETIAVIHEAGGLAVLAHPHLIQNPRTVQQLLTLPLDGIEVYYARFPLVRVQEWLTVAERKGWIVTGGSDYHGEAKPQIALGSSWVSEALFEVLEAHYQRLT